MANITENDDRSIPIYDSIFSFPSSPFAIGDCILCLEKILSTLLGINCIRTTVGATMKCVHSKRLTVKNALAMKVPNVIQYKS